MHPLFVALPADAPERKLVKKAAGLLEVLIAGFDLDEETRKKMELGVAPLVVPLVVLGVAVSFSVAAIAWAIVAYHAASALSDWCEGFREEVQARKAAMEQGKTLPPGTPMVNVPSEATQGAGGVFAAVALLGVATFGFYLFLKK